MPRYDKNEVKDHARGYWSSILEQVAGIGADFLTGDHGPCPKCGGGRSADRWRFTNLHQNGGAICNQCDARMGDGLAVLSWYLDITFIDALQRVAEFLGVSPIKERGSRKPTSTGGKSARPPSIRHPTLKKDPPKKREPIDIEFLPWNEQLARGFCRKHGIDIEALKRFGTKRAKYRGRDLVFAIPLPGEHGTLAGYTIYPQSGGKFRTRNPRTGKPEFLKYRTVKEPEE